MLDDLYVLRDRARVLAQKGDLDGAAAALTAAAAQFHVGEQDYVTILRPLEDILVRRGDYRGALTVLWYLAMGEAANGPSWKRATALLPNVPPVDRARTLATMGEMDQAAREMENAGLVAAAAICREKAKDWQGARALWSRLSRVKSGGANAYHVALVEFNLARSAKQCGDARQAREAIVAAVRLLKEAADHFETVGQRERAFDAFQVLVQIGRESGAFEDVLEGFVNCIRILREDHLKYFALQYYEDALTAAKGKEEFSAAATLAREAAEYSRALGLAPPSAHYTIVQAELWQKLAWQHATRGAPPEIAENAILAAILAFGEVGQFAKVGELYQALAQINLEEARKVHYARASKRYAGVRDEPIDAAPLPSHLRQENHFPEVWHVDVLEWEQQGSASEACADVLLNRVWPDLHPAKGPPRAPHRVHGRGASRRRRGAGDRRARAARRAARRPPDVRGALAAGEALRASGARGEGRRAPGDEDALLQAELHHRARRAARRQSGGRRASGQRDRVSLLPARLQSAVAHRS